MGSLNQNSLKTSLIEERQNFDQHRWVSRRGFQGFQPRRRIVSERSERTPQKISPQVSCLEQQSLPASSFEFGSWLITSMRRGRVVVVLQELQAERWQAERWHDER